MFLLLLENFAKVFGHGVFAERLALPDALAVVPHRLVFVSRSKRSMSSALSDVFTSLATVVGVAAEIVDELGDDERMFQLFGGMFLQLFGDCHVLRALDRL